MYHLIAGAVCIFGVLVSVLAMCGEQLKWRTFTTFSVATKVPVEIFCISGPVVLVTGFLYSFLAFLLLTERGTNSVFYIASSWTVVFMDMTLVMHDDWRGVWQQPVDLSIHIVDVLITLYSFWKLPFVPSAFLLCGSGFWGIVVLLRSCRPPLLDDGSDDDDDRRRRDQAS